MPDFVLRQKDGKNEKRAKGIKFYNIILVKILKS